jgi:LytR cell envelope-related transcriptional attenuator
MHLVQEIGSYAGFAAVVGLAVLSALYFSQARDVKRLREWAGRAPERAAEEEARISAAAQAQAQAQQRAAAGGGGATVVRPPQPQPQPGAAANPPPSGVPAPPPPTLPSARPTAAGAGAPSTPILAGMRPSEPWYRRIHWPAPRYIALIVVGILVLGAGAAYGVSQLGSNDSGATNASVTHAGSSSTSGKSSSSSKKSHKPATLNKGSITVAVLNGTTVTGLAATTASKIEQAGFKRGTTDNALTQGQQAESVVEYAKGNQRAAQAVGKQLGITQFEPIDPETQRLAGDATVAVIIGADLAGGSSSG